jgi:hypothetical protein
MEERISGLENGISNRREAVGGFIENEEALEWSNIIQHLKTHQELWIEHQIEMKAIMKQIPRI